MSTNELEYFIDEALSAMEASADINLFKSGE